MKTILLFISFSIYAPVGWAQTTNSAKTLKTNLCKTWVAFKETEHIPMLNRHETKELVQKSERDSLIIHVDNTIERFHRDRIYIGNWNVSNDSTKIIFKFPDCSNYYFSLGAEEFLLETLTENGVKMLCDMGKEGEYTERLFKSATVKIK